jgi:intracellular sulfur oxidation DsrE/DsrF family protein
MNKLSGLFICAICLAGALKNTVTAQSAGPVIPGYGKVWKIADADIPGAGEMKFHAVFDVYDSTAAEEGGVNRQLETAARYLNLHAQNGIKLANMKVALVVHGTATEDLLVQDTYRARHGIPNANVELVNALLEAGVQIVVCGQSASARNIRRNETLEGVQWALSAMTALVYFQNKGYRLIKF